jgi:sugar phosphate isomerase/epimerase
MLCYSTGSLPDAFTFSEIAKLLSPSPFKGVELVVTADMLKRADESRYWRAIRAEFEAGGLCVRNVHMGAPFLMGPIPHQPGLSSLDPMLRSRKAEAAEKCLAIAVSLGSPNVTLTTGLPDSELAMDRHVESLKSVIAGLIKSKPQGMDFMIEQEPEHVIRSSKQLLDLAKTFLGDVFINFDVGHSQVLGEDIGSSLLELAPYLRNIHLEDIKDRVHAHKLYGDGDVDFTGIFRSLREIKYQGDFTPDLYPFKDDFVNAMDASIRFLRAHEVLVTPVT